MTEKPKLNKESLEKHFPKVEIPRLHYDYDLSMEYKSPIQVRVEKAVKTLNLQVENEVYNLVRKYEITVDEAELRKALQYDRNQYELGYRAGYNKAFKEALSAIDDLKKEMLKTADTYYGEEKTRQVAMCEIIYQLAIAKLMNKYGGAIDDGT